MNAAVEPLVLQLAAVERAAAAACSRIAPTWPLDRFIAVNPYWGWREQPITQAAAQLGQLSGTRLTMPRAYYRQLWQAGRVREAHLQAAIARTGSTASLETLLQALQAQDTACTRLALATDRIDATRDLSHAMAWSAFVTHQISQHCAAHFDRHQAQWHPDPALGLYNSWREAIVRDHSAALLMGESGLAQRAAGLPQDTETLLVQASQALGLHTAADAPGLQAYFTALLLSVNGWASWCAFQQWEAQLAGGSDETLRELLAVRLAWEWLLQQGPGGSAVDAQWASAWNALPPVPTDTDTQLDWLLQLALEIGYQQSLCDGLLQAPAPAPEPAAPAVQAVFCIDVRSEVFRRALERTSAQVQTRGFAGFFGVPVAWQPIGTELRRPQLPGLLAPRAVAEDQAESPALGQVIARRRRQRLQWSGLWKQFRSGASSGFSFVESCGLAYAGQLAADSLCASAPASADRAGLGPAAATLRPALPAIDPADAAALQARCDMAQGVLRAMGLPGDAGWARLVLLAGHGSRSANNPHAAGLDCGACGGQTGEVNARVLAGLLNDATIRDALRARGLVIPADTWFVPGLHCTTTDEVELFDLRQLPASHAADVAQLQQWLRSAGDAARAERAPALGLEPSSGSGAARLAASIFRRSRDWSQVRPEWALANNAAFFVAPRSRTRHLDLQGRAFLHDYDWRQDQAQGWSVLELVMTAPMVVTNWINLQYHASVVDPVRYGSGNKVLHNVVGGTIGVFEGNGGDLRIGLPWQSVHDGEQFRHTPLRLSVFIEAPAEAIDAIVARHEVVRQLVDNGWLHLLCIDPAQGRVLVRRAGGGWADAGAAAATAAAAR